MLTHMPESVVATVSHIGKPKRSGVQRRWRVTAVALILGSHIERYPSLSMGSRSISAKATPSTLNATPVAAGRSSPTTPRRLGRPTLRHAPNAPTLISKVLRAPCAHPARVTEGPRAHFRERDPISEAISGARNSLQEQG